MTEFRPIILCNVGNKVISKVLCQWLKGVLPKLISKNQSAFVPGRLISDNILIALEIFYGLRTNGSCKEKYMAIKIDMSKVCGMAFYTTNSEETEFYRGMAYMVDVVYYVGPRPCTI